MIQKFIVVDDDSISNILSRIIIETVFPKADIQTYTDPETALLYIQSAYRKTNALATILFLDINMPTLTGWKFLDAFEEFDINVKNQLKVYMLSSSVDPRDKERAAGNQNVLGYFEKPLTREYVETVANKY